MSSFFIRRISTKTFPLVDDDELSECEWNEEKTKFQEI